MSITPGVIQEISNSGTPFQPIVQVLEIRSIAVPPGPSSGGQSERYKLKISDGTYFMQAMLTTQHNNLIYDGSLQENGLIRLDEYVCNVVQERKICIIVNLTVVAPAMHYGKAGNPIAIESAALAPPPMAPPAHDYGYGAPAASAHAPSYAAPMKPTYGGAPAPVAPRPYGSSVATSTETPRYVPVASLNPFVNKWTIKVRVTAKGEKRTWSNARGEGSLFSVDLLDQYGSQIRATFFREAVDMFYDLIQKDSVYFMSNGRLKAANKQFTSITNDYEITFDRNSAIQLAPEDAAIKHVQFNFVTIQSLETAQKDSSVDVLAVIKDVSATHAFTSKAGKELVKRDVTLVDASSTSVSLTLWGAACDLITEASVGNLLAVKGARVGEFGGGRQLSTNNSSVLQDNPTGPEAAKLKAWWDTEGSTKAVATLSGTGGGGGGGGATGPTNNAAARKTFAAIKAENLGSTDQGDVFTVKGTINYIRSDGDKPPWYPACTTPSCNKKAVQDMTGTNWHCEKCNVSFPEPSYRYILSSTAVDHTGSEWVTLFNDQATTVLDSHTANEMSKIKESGDAALPAWNAVFQQANFRQYMFRLKAKREMVNDQMRLKVSCLWLRPVEYAKECRTLLDAIKQYDAKP